MTYTQGVALEIAERAHVAASSTRKGHCGRLSNRQAEGYLTPTRGPVRSPRGDSGAQMAQDDVLSGDQTLAVAGGTEASPKRDRTSTEPTPKQYRRSTEAVLVGGQRSDREPTEEWR